MIIKKKILLLPSIIFTCILLIFFYLLTTDRDPSLLPSALINKSVPSFEAVTLEKNKKFISSESFINKITLVNFFATWCKPCRDEHVYIERFSKEENINIIGINYKDDRRKTIKWLKNMGNPYSEVIIDKNGRIAIDWGVYGIPETFFVDSNGIIKYRHVGPINKKVYNQINLIIKENE